MSRLRRKHGGHEANVRRCPCTPLYLVMFLAITTACARSSKPAPPTQALEDAGAVRDATASGPSAPAVSIDAISSVGHAWCHWRARCTPDELSALYGGLEGCLSQAECRWRRGGKPAGLTETCLRAVADESCRQGVLPFPARVAACELVEPAGLGEACSRVGCEPASYCDRLQEGRELVCSECVPRRSEGESCVGRVDDCVGRSCPHLSWDCEAGSRCDLGTHTCVVVRAAGERCETRAQCGVLPCTQGLCRWAREGEPCASGECAPDLRCSEALCAPLIDVGERCQDVRACVPGAACVEGTCQLLGCAPGREGAACETECAEGFECASGRCAPQAASGEPCDAQLPNPCLNTAEEHCAADGRCRPRPGVGEPCAAFDCVLGARCSDAGVCVARGQLGEPCDASIGCQGSLCIAGVCQPEPVCGGSDSP